MHDIFYYVQAHGALDEFRKIFDLYYSERNRYLVLLDAPWSGSLRGLEERHNVTVRRSSPVVWGGWSLVANLYDAIRFAQQERCRWFMNLSGACVPLKPQDMLVEALRARPGASLVNHWLMAKPLAQLDGERSGVYRTVKIGSKTVLNVDTGLAIGADFNPAQNLPLRFAAAYHEVWSTKQHDVVPLGAVFRDAITRLHEARALVCGRQWLMLSMEAASFLVDAELACRLNNALRHVFVPDEAVPQTILYNSPLQPTLCKDNGRWLGGQAVQIQADDIEPILGSPSFFARKLSPGLTDRFVEAYRRRYG
jgi:hypothetical protein